LWFSHNGEQQQSVRTHNPCQDGLMEVQVHDDSLVCGGLRTPAFMLVNETKDRRHMTYA
jgi:hypothetical protein